VKAKRRTIDELKELAASSPTAAARHEAMQELVRQLMDSRRAVRICLPTKNRIRFGLVSDSHLGSAFERLDVLEDVYANAKARGITDMLHAGDLLEGEKMHRGQEYEIHRHGWAQQRDWAKDKYPRVNGITTHFITGNHDGSFKKAAGIDVGDALAQCRDDWRFIGDGSGTVTFTTDDDREYRVMLHHPGGGASYAISYRAQKIVEALPGGSKPNMLVIGHYHKLDWLPSYRNVSVIQPGCAQSQTPFMESKGLAAHVGAWFFEVDFFPQDTLRMQVKGETLTYY